MAYCIHCGKQIDDNMKFCPHCGKTQEMTAAQTTPYGGMSGQESPASGATPYGTQPLAKKNTGLIIGIVCALVTVAALVVIAAVLFAARKPSSGNATRSTSEKGRAAQTSDAAEEEEDADTEETSEEEDADDKDARAGTAAMREKISQYDATVVETRVLFEVTHEGKNVRLMDFTYEMYDLDTLPESVLRSMESEAGSLARSYHEYRIDSAQSKFDEYINDGDFQPESEEQRLVAGRLDEVILSYLLVRKREYSNFISYGYDYECIDMETGRRIRLDDIISNKGSLKNAVMKIVENDNTISRRMQEKGSEIEEYIDEHIKRDITPFLMTHEGLLFYFDTSLFEGDEAYMVLLPYTEYADLFYEDYLRGVLTLEDAEKHITRNSTQEKIDIPAYLKENELPALYVNDIRPLDGRWDVEGADGSPGSPTYIRITAASTYYNVYVSRYDDIYSGRIAVSTEEEGLYLLYDYDDDYKRIEIGTVKMAGEDTIVLTLHAENLTLNCKKSSERY